MMPDGTCHYCGTPISPEWGDYCSECLPVARLPTSSPSKPQARGSVVPVTIPEGGKD